ncbi:DUF7261 family protein [Halovenus halobia]|uniref:DUF7261 family protein n=1 Tax=Halovenus halobia TaxID=3396622 RepID=UPI003F551EE6
MVNSHRERGQLVLIAAILVATAILGAVVLLNAVHSSPNVKAQSDAQSLSDTEQMTEQLHHHVRKLFFATSTGDGEKQQPYAEIGALGPNVTAYNAQLGTFVSREKPVVTNVTYLGGAEGDFVAGSIPSLVPEQVIDDAESIPYLRVNASDSQQPVEIDITGSGGTNKRVVLDGANTEYGETGSLQDCSLSPGRATLILTHGSGEIRGATGGLCQFTLYERGELDTYTIEIGGTGTGDGTFNVSGVRDGSDVAEPGFAVRERNVIVNPTVEISYQTPSVAYESEYTLFTGADE